MLRLLIKEGRTYLVSDLLPGRKCEMGEMGDLCVPSFKSRFGMPTKRKGYFSTEPVEACLAVNLEPHGSHLQLFGSQMSVFSLPVARSITLLEESQY